MKREKKVRYILQLDGEELGGASSLRGIAEILGCSFQYVHKRLKDGNINYNKKVYTIIDRLA